MLVPIIISTYVCADARAKFRSDCDAASSADTFGAASAATAAPASAASAAAAPGYHSDISSRMDKAVSQQHYAEAEQFRVRLKELAEEKALAAEKEQHVSPKDSLGKVRLLLLTAAINSSYFL